jgi:hypothetical protein
MELVHSRPTGLLDSLFSNSNKVLKSVYYSSLGILFVIVIKSMRDFFFICQSNFCHSPSQDFNTNNTTQKRQRVRTLLMGIM